MAVPRFKHPQIVTANDLYDGDVVYLTKEGGWSIQIGDAAIAEDAERAAALLSKGGAQVSRIVGAYLADVSINDDGKPEPVHFRERFRTRGPSNYFHGKQAEIQ
ncbi:MAG: DUF2849 domain-containing protein [Pseudomonadota bacterium]